MMRICHVITRLIIGGAQENTLLSCEGLHGRGHRVLLLSGPDTGAEGSLWDRASLGGYEVRMVPSLRREVGWKQEFSALRELREQYSEFNPDVIHTHSSKAGILGRRAANVVPAAKVVHTIHGMSFNRTQPWWKHRFYRYLERSVAQRTDQFVSVADAMTHQAVAAGLASEDRFVTIRSGIQTDWYQPDEQAHRELRTQWGFGDGEIVVGSVARLFRNKGYERLIPAMARAIQQNPLLRFVWVGDGPQRAVYEQELRSLGIADKVVLTGLVRPQEVSRFMQGMDFLVHCSMWEGLPRAAVQALLLERPVVCFDVDGAAEVVEEGVTGKLVELGNVVQLEMAILELASDGALRHRMGRAGRKRCLQAFDHELMVEQLESLYRRLLS